MQMREFTLRIGRRVFGPWFQSGICGLLLFVTFISSIDSSQSTNANGMSTSVSSQSFTLMEQKDLTNEQQERIVTVEFDVSKISTTALRIIYFNMRKAIVDYLNRRKKSSSIPTTATTDAVTTVVPRTVETTTVVLTTVETSTIVPTAIETTAVVPTTFETTTVVPTTVETTTVIPTTIETTTVVPTTFETTTVSQAEPAPARKRRESEDKDYMEEDFPFIEVKPAIKDGILRIPLSYLKEGIDPNKLFDAAKDLKQDGTLTNVTGVPAVKVYQGMPVSQMFLDYRVWLPILLIIFLLIIIFIFTFCWKIKDKKVENKTPRTTEENKLEQEPTKVNPLKATTGRTLTPVRHAPVNLDDESGWIVPYDQFKNDSTY